MDTSAFLVNGTDIDRWAADSIIAESHLPVLVRKLIRASCPSAIIQQFRDEKGIYLPGWDGIVETPTGGAQIPAGKSVWELSVRGDCQQKAEEDYQTRTTKPLDEDPSQCCLILVTARKWPKKDAWQKSKMAEGKWRDIKVYDADDLAQWLESFRAVHLEFSTMLGKAPYGVRVLKDYWHDWSHATTLPITPQLLLAGRQDAAKKVINWLAGNYTNLNLQADTPSEAIAFLAAVIMTLPSDDRELAFSKALVVEDNASWRQLIVRDEQLILVAHQPDRNSININLDGSKHLVFIPLGPAERAGEDDIILPRVSYLGVREILESVGVKGNVDELAQTMRHSLGAFRRLLAKNKVILIPEWAKTPNAALIPAILLTQWEDSNEHDKGAIERLSGNKYSQTLEVLKTLSRISDPPVRVHGNIWRIVSPQDSWELIASQLVDRSLLKAFEELALEILNEIDPKWELTGNDRMMASVSGAIPQYSHTLRYGMARALALMGSNQELSSIDGEVYSAWAAAIIRKLFKESKSWQFWASHYHTLSLLAEAAPDEFLDAITRDLRDDSPSTAELFREEEDDFLTASPHCGLLWALEVLAWSPDYLSSAALALAKLVALDPGGSLANRPLNSLQRIFCNWHPYTSASLEERLQVLELLYIKEPAVVWELLLSLLPSVSSMVHNAQMPHYRDWVPESLGTITYGEIWETTSKAVSWLLKLVDTDVDRWCQLLSYVVRLSDEDSVTIVDKLLLRDNEISDSEKRWQIWSTANKQLALLDKREAGAASKGKHQTTLLESVRDTFNPSEDADSARWLFCNQAWLELKDTEYPEYKDKDTRIQELRLEAVKKLWQKLSWEGVLELAGKVNSPNALGWTAGVGLKSVEDEAKTLESWISSEIKHLREFGLGYIGGRINQVGQAWVIDLLTSRSSGDRSCQFKVELIKFLPFNAATWDLLEKDQQEVGTLYWQSVWPFGKSASQEEYERAIDELEKCERYLSALEYIRDQQRYDHLEFPADKAIYLLFALANNPPSIESSNEKVMLDYTVGEIIRALCESNLVDSSVIAKLQYAYLPIYAHGRQKPMELFRLLGDKPAVFMEVLRGAYKRKDDGRKEQKADSTSKANARHNWNVLHEWSLPPGCAGDGSVDSSKLQSWVREVRELAEKEDLKVPCDAAIGRVLAHMPIGADGVWPHEALRDLIQEMSCESLENELYCGILNTRGMVSKSLGEGGKQERVLSDKYTQYADKLRSRWPRISAVLRGVAKSYKLQAKREDERSTLEEDGIF
ncbi:hypothetical protein JW859_01010 [bacterium]|nr:hypothetical protein [bacterium]